MRALRLKLRRDAWRLRGQLAAIAVVVVCGVAMFIGLRAMHSYLVTTLAGYYHAYRFADVFAPLLRAPRAVADELALVPGVAAVRTRIVAEVVADVPGLHEPATLRLVSLPARGDAALNGVHVRRGRLPEADRPGEALASEAFARANDLDIGDTLGAVLNGRWQALTITGMAMSPEFVYEIRGAGEMFPDNRRYGVVWMGEAGLATAFDLEGACNDVVLALAPGASAIHVLPLVDRVLAPWGGSGAYAREDQLSHRFLADEITETQVSSVLTPTIFLAVTAFLLHMVMTRLVATQRDQIAVLKAFGYGDLQVARHYLGLAAMPVGAGAAVGVALGLWLAGRFAVLYAQFFQFPVLHYTPDGLVVVSAVVASGGAALLGASAAVLRAARLPPAEAMRPEAPPRFGAGPLERLGLHRWLSPGARMVVRNIERRPMKAAASMVGIGLAAGMTVASVYIFDAIDRIKEIQFRRVQREDVTVVFRSARSLDVVYDLAALPGVQRVEPIRLTPVRLVAGPREERVAITGLTPDSRLRRIVDRANREVPLPPAGLLLTAALAERLGVAPGDVLWVEVLEGRRSEIQLPVAATADELIGLNAYLDLDALDRLLGEPATLNAALLAVEPGRAAPLYDALKRMPAVSGVAVREASLRGFEATFEQSFRISITAIVLFACVIAFAIVYNSARIGFSERARELASLRILGFSRAGTARLLLGEQAVVTALGVPIGWGIGLVLSLLITARSSETWRIPLVIRPVTYLFGSIVVVGAAVVSAWLVRRRVERLDLVAVLKTRE